MLVKDAGRPEQPKTPKKDASDLGTVRLVCRPGPDAEDRLRRLFSLLVSHATRGKDLPSRR